MGWFSDLTNRVESVAQTVSSKASGAYNSVSSYFSGSTPLKITIPAPSTNWIPSLGSVASYFPSAITKIESIGSDAAGSVQSFFSGLETKAAAAGDAVTTRLKSYATGAAETAGQVVGSAARGIVSGMGLPTMIVILAVVFGLAYIYVRRP